MFSLPPARCRNSTPASRPVFGTTAFTQFNTPTQNMGKMIFQMPRNEEIFYENNLMKNKKRFWKTNRAACPSNDYDPYFGQGWSMDNSEKLRNVAGLVDTGRRGKTQHQRCRTNLEKAEATFKQALANAKPANRSHL